MTKIQTVSKVLKIKSMKKEEIEYEIKKIKGLIDKEQDRLDSIEKAFKGTAETLTEKQKKGMMNINELGLFYNYLIKLKADMNEQKKIILRKLSELDDKKADLLEAYKEKKLIEVLKDKMVREHSREQTASEQKNIDYMFISRRRRE